MDNINSITRIQFGVLSANSIRRFSAVDLTPKLDRPISSKNNISKDGSLDDLRLGAQENGEICYTCGETNIKCQGHQGHIELPVPVYNPLFLNTVLQVLRCVCHKCSRMRVLPTHCKIQGVFSSSSGLNIIHKYIKNHIIPVCPHEDCADEDGEKTILPSYKSDKKDDIYQFFPDEKEFKQIVPPSYVLRVLDGISRETCAILGFNKLLSPAPIFSNKKYLSMTQVHCHEFHPRDMIFTAFPVLPPSCRPFVIQDGEKKEDKITQKYFLVLRICERIAKSKITTTSRNGLQIDRRKLEADLKMHITAIISSDTDTTNSSGKNKSIKERLEKKEGDIRKYCMGKRCDQSGRGPITGGGLLLKNNELGVPHFIAEKMSVKRKVRESNLDMMQSFVSQGIGKCVIRGYRTIHISVLPEKGRQFKLRPGDYLERELIDGDIVVFNRQPTLRDGSMQGFVVKRIKGWAFRLGLLFTKQFNADFDGADFDE